jgi:hypothetical protein
LLLLISNTRYSRDHTGLYKQAMMMERRGGDDQVERIKKAIQIAPAAPNADRSITLTAPAKKACVCGADRK